MAQQYATLRGLFGRPDPRAQQPGALDTAFDPASVTTSAELFRQCRGSSEPYVFLAHSSDMNGPMPLVVPFALDVLGGTNNTGESCALVGDVADNGALPPAVVVDATIFDTVMQSTVPTRDTTSALWNALPAAEHHLHVPNNDTELVDTRQAVPVPHPCVTPILQAHQNDELEWWWLVVNVMEPIINAPAHLQAYPHFLNWLRVSGTLQAPDAAGAEDRAQTHMECAAVFGRPRVTRQVPDALARYLNGLQPASNVSQSLNNMAQHQQAMATQLAIASQPRDKTLMEINPIICRMALKVSEQHRVQDLTPFWLTYHLVHKQGHQAALEQAASTSAFAKPLMGPKFSTDFAAGKWVAHNGSAIDEGLSITRITTCASSPSDVARHNRAASAFHILEMCNATGDGLVDLIMTDDTAQLPRSSMQLSIAIQACYAFLETIFGPRASLVTAYRSQLIDHNADIMQAIIREYYTREHEICLKIIIHIFRQTNAAIHSLLSGAIPTAAVPQPTPQDPGYDDILRRLLAGQATSLVDLPDALVTRLRGPPTQASGSSSSTAGHDSDRLRGGNNNSGASNTGTGAAAGAGSSRSSGPSRAPVRGDDNWNVPLRAAWTASGHSALFTAGSPFHRANNPPKNRVSIQRLAGDRSKRICLKMACTNECMDNCSMCHGDLTPEEHQAIAREGGFQL